MAEVSSSLKQWFTAPVIARLLGLFLLVTAGLKVHGLIVDPYGQENFLALPWLQVLTIEVEVLVGLWLLSGVQLRLALMASLLLFVVFAALSFMLAWQGQADCGCFGKVKVNPWFTFTLDIVLVGILAWAFYRSVSTIYYRTTSPAFSSIVQVLLTSAGMLGLVTLALTIFSDDPWATLARIRGETLCVHPAVFQLGEGQAGELRDFQVTLRNISDKPIKVIGGTTSCSCITTKDLPLTIPASQSIVIAIKIKFSGTPGKFSHRYSLYSDSEERLTIARFSGTVSTNELRSDNRQIQQTPSTN